MEDSWDAIAFQECTKVWTRFENGVHGTTRFQDLSFHLELSSSHHDIDRQNQKYQETSQSWPFESSPCRFFGGRNTRPNHKCKELNYQLFAVDFADHLSDKAMVCATDFFWNSESSLQTSRSFKRRTADETELVFITEKRTDRRTSFERSNGSLTASCSELLKHCDQENEQSLFSNHVRATVRDCELTQFTEEDDLLDNSQLITSPLTLSQQLGWMTDGCLEEKTPALISSQVIQRNMNIDRVSYAPFLVHDSSNSCPCRSPQQYGIKSPHQEISNSLPQYHSVKKLERNYSQQENSQKSFFRHKEVPKLSSVPCTPIDNHLPEYRDVLMRGMSRENVELPPESHECDEMINGFLCAKVQLKKKRRNAVGNDPDNDDSSLATDSTRSSHSFGGENEDDVFAANRATPCNSCSSFSLDSQSSKREIVGEERNDDEDALGVDSSEQGRCFRQLFCDRSTIKVEDFVHRRNRSILHSLVYRHHLKVDMDDLKAKVIDAGKTCDARIASLTVHHK
jgi:hypothetical protein